MKAICQRSLGLSDDAENYLAGGQQAIDDSACDSDSFYDMTSLVSLHRCLFLRR